MYGEVSGRDEGGRLSVEVEVGGVRINCVGFSVSRSGGVCVDR